MWSFTHLIKNMHLYVKIANFNMAAGGVGVEGEGLKLFIPSLPLTMDPSENEITHLTVHHLITSENQVKD